MPNHFAVFPRNFKKSLPVAVCGEGCWIIDESGRRYLDASGQAAVASIGHGVPEIGRAMAAQSSQIAFAHTTQFRSASAEKLAVRLLALAPPGFREGRVYFTSGGSEAAETAIKLARQFHLESGQGRRYRVVSRRRSGGTSRRVSAITARSAKTFRIAVSLAPMTSKGFFRRTTLIPRQLLFLNRSSELLLVLLLRRKATRNASRRFAGRGASF